MKATCRSRLSHAARPSPLLTVPNGTATGQCTDRHIAVTDDPLLYFMSVKQLMYC